MGILERIVQHKKREISKDCAYRSLLFDMIMERRVYFNFEKALTSCRTKIIAEIKRASPSSGNIRDVCAVEQAKEYEQAGAVAISVLTDRDFFKGSLEDLYQVRKVVNLPLLRKDFIIDQIQLEEAKAFGADVVLLIVRILDDVMLKDLLDYSKELGLSHIVEVFDLNEAEIALKSGAKIVGINNRDLDTFQVDINRSKHLGPKIKDMGARFVIAESGIESREQILELENAGIDAFLIGTSLMKSDDPARKLRELMGFTTLDVES